MHTLYLLTGLSEQGKAWISEHVQVEPYQMVGHSIAVEHRYIEDIAQAMTAEGLQHGIDFSILGA